MKKVFLYFIAIVIMFSVGCSQRLEGKVVVEEHKNISTNQSELKNMDVYQYVDGVSWLNDNQLIENHADGIYVRDTKQKQTTLLLKVTKSSPVSVLSPNKEHLLIAKDSEQSGEYTYQIFHLSSRNLVQVQSRPIYFSDPKWIDNENLLATDAKGNIYQIHISGKVSKLNHQLQQNNGGENWYQLDKVGEQYFFVENYQLWVWNERTRQTKKLLDRVDRFVLSPDKKQLAVIQVVPTLPSEAEQEDVLLGRDTLLLMDLNGQVKSTIAKGDYLSSRIIWSYDASMLAYIKTDREQPPRLYVANTRNNEAPILLAVNLDGELIEWNPSGTQLCINGFVNLKSPEEGFALHVIRLK
jgi:PBP1b-binding outer membrane lipoprotein LpoB